MRYKMVRKNIFEVLETKWNIINEIKKFIIY